MTRGTDPFWEYVESLPNKRWKCNFCGKPYAGSATRIKAHLAGVGGYGINDCKHVIDQVRLEARTQFKEGRGVAESSNRSKRNVEKGPHLPVTANNEHAWKETSFAAMPDLSSDIMSTLGAGSAFFPLLETNLPNQSLPDQIVIPDFSSCPPSRQFNAGDSSTQPPNFNYPSSDPEFWNDMVRSLMTEEGEPTIEVSRELSNGAEGNIEEGLHQPVITSNEDGPREISFADVPSLDSNAMSTIVASSSDFLPSHEMNVPSQYLPTQNMTTHGDFSFGTQPPQSHAGDSNIQQQNLSNPSSGGDLTPEAFTKMPHPVNAEEGEPNTEVPQDVRTKDAVMVSRPGNCGLVNENMPSLKKKRGERSNREVVNNCRYRSFRKSSMTHATRCRKSSPLLTTELVGKESEKTINKICDYLMEDENVIIGIYGMGGVGKTAILLHVQNRVLEDSTFNDVFWVTVPQEFSVYELQDEIANVVGLDDLLKYKDVKRRACILDKHLKKKERSILLLDGMWKHFEVKDVGIPIKKSGLKLVFTTWSLDVCHKMLCQKLIKIEPLSLQGDAWNLFLETLGEKEITSEVEKFARLIVQECGGLPLGIIEIATCMRGVEEVYEWKDMLRKLKESRVELDVFKRLKLCYVNLADSQVQQCFLNLTQKFENSQGACLNTSLLIESFIDEDLLDGTGTRQGLHECGNAILNKLRKGCLCEGVDQFIYLHPLIRGMALHMVRSPTHMVETYMELKEIPKEKFWTNCLEKVFLQGNNIKEIPDGISPNCPKLMRLSLNDNFFLEAIHKSFFRHLKGLEVLDLCQTKIRELPDTLSHLESLEALLLRGCKELFRIPCLQKLRSLRKLDLSGCAMLKEVPEGMEMLVKLSYLDLRGTEIETLSQGMLGKLVNLQYLAIGKGQTWLKGVLKKMEVFYCFISNVETFNACVRFLEQNSSLPYELWLNDSGDHYFKDKHKRHIIIENCHSIAAMVDGEIGGDGHALLPKNVQVLEVRRCDGMTSLCEVGPLDNLAELEIEEWEKLEELGAGHFPRLWRLNITRCTKLKHFLKEGHELRCLQWLKIEGSEELEGINIAAPFLYNIEVYRCPKMKWVLKWQCLATRLPNLRSIKIKDCEQLEEILGGLPPIGAPCRLTSIEIDGCNNLKRVLMTHDMLLHLPLLQVVIVRDCMGIEVIIGTVPNMTQPSFLNLINLILQSLPEVKSICEGTVSCLSIQYMSITKCPKLKRLPLLHNGLHCGDSIEIDEVTWQSLEWDQSPFQPSLQDLARRYGVSNWHDQRICVRIESRNAITPRVDGLIGGEGRNLLPRNVQVLEVGGGSGVTSLSEVGPLENLKELTIKDCEKLEELGAVHFPQLERLDINCCSKLKRLSVEGQGLPHLRWFTITGSEELEGIDLAAPNLNSVKVRCCHKMKRVVEWDWLTTRLPNLKSIEIIYCEKLEEIIGGPLPIGATCLLMEIKIESCNNMKGVLLTHDMLLHIPFLQDIIIINCEGIEVIIGTAPNMTQSSFPKLTHLTLWNLPELKRICDRMESCDHIQYIEMYNCWELKSIPLRLHLLDNGLLSPPPSLGRIVIEDKKTWQALEWDHPLAPISLEPFIEFLS
ncbi:hypothetical protein ACJRO7_023060 [Eucalyptus globulus]|uniref:BED-type domain-containing protein n=1 Tax=Eucalyptus globulus TaxID=34317 RepID=A0ABD3K1P5_EUCGL